MPEIRVQFPVGPLNAVPWSNGNDAWFTSRLAWFDSIRDYSTTPRYANRPERLGSDPRVCRFDSCSGYSKQFVLVEQRSARLPVTQEIVGSNPIGDAFNNLARCANPAERRISNVRGCGFDSLPCY